MNSDRSSTVSSSLSVTLARENLGITNQLNSSQTKSFKSPINQFYCNICFCPLMTVQNMNCASFVTSCGHFYCELCAQTSKLDSFSTDDVLVELKLFKV
ncbi:unnamed protein product [Adineta ricciae]|uniref:RING-type domain-containing protein n=1 Tax=Adineta ricciae TaxID=249248 RepID=A0A816HJY7_ADIRI|nr:unnamed protein product [Adineta ricciae]